MLMFDSTFITRSQTEDFNCIVLKIQPAARLYLLIIMIRATVLFPLTWTCNIRRESNPHLGSKGLSNTSNVISFVVQDNIQ